MQMLKLLLRWLGFHIHEWSKWEQSNVDVPYDDGVGTAYVLCRLKRTCQSCGWSEYRQDPGSGWR